MAENIVMTWLRDFLTALAADVVYGKGISRSSPGGQVPTVGGQVGGQLGEQLRQRWFGLGFDDEAAFLQAMSELTPAEQVTIASRVKALGSPDKEDTPEARTFRKTLIKLPTAEARVKALKGLASLPAEDWETVVKVTGAATTGQLGEALKRLQQLFGSVPVLTKAADQKAAARLDSFGAKVCNLTARLRAKL